MTRSYDDDSDPGDDTVRYNLDATQNRDGHDDIQHESHADIGQASDIYGDDEDVVYDAIDGTACYVGRDDGEENDGYADADDYTANNEADYDDVGDGGDYDDQDEYDCDDGDIDDYE